MINLAFIVSGCGVYSGTENNEMTLSMLSASQNGATTEIFAPNEQCIMSNPFGKITESHETSNILYESAKITRGKVKDLSLLNIENFDALVLPGGFGVIKNLSNIAKYEMNKEEIIVNPIVKKIIKDFHNVRKPILAICIAPLLVASVINNAKITLGAFSNKPKDYPIKFEYIECNADSFYLDEENLIYSTPAFMSSNDLGVIYKGISNACSEMLKKLNITKD
jgi:enhancing lycopene biosynthesis protein 2